MSQQGPLAAVDIPYYAANAKTVNVSVSAAGYTQLVACPAAYQNGENAAYRPVIYIGSIQFDDATSSTFSFVDSNALTLAGPFEGNTAFFQTFNGLLSTNPSSSGASFGINLTTAPAAAFGVFVSYWTT